MMLKTVFSTLLCVSSLSQYADFDKLHASKVQIPSSVRLHAQGCWTKAHLSIKRRGTSSFLQQLNVPGAGIDNVEPFDMVLNDGFLKVNCIKDYMYYHGDKFGDNKHDYKLSRVSRVSIVHYDAYVPKEDRNQITPQVCFEFCRTVPNMGFFGIVNGRSCYCTPYFIPMESDSSQCDAVCEGDSTNVCGGQSKSSIFAMHMCDSTKDDLGERRMKAALMKKRLTARVKTARKRSAAMQVMSANLQEVLGEVGDSGATGLLQSAKQFAGELEYKADEVEAEENKLAKLADEKTSLKDFTSPANVAKAKRVMEGIDETMERARAVADELITLEAYAQGQHKPRAAAFKYGGDVKLAPSSLSTPKGCTVMHEGAWIDSAYRELGYFDHNIDACVESVVKTSECQDGIFDYNSDDGFCSCALSVPVEFWSDNGPNWRIYKMGVRDTPSPLKQYYPVMYFADKQFEKVPTTCTGDLVAKPIVGKEQTADLCAAACNANLHDCAGFQYFRDGADSLCFLFSKFNTGFYYAGCGEASSEAFLQTRSASFEASCYAKVSKFEGTSLAPKPNGKCKQCFKELTKADRCY